MIGDTLSVNNLASSFSSSSLQVGRWETMTLEDQVSLVAPILVLGSVVVAVLVVLGAMGIFPRTVIGIQI